MVVKDAVIFKNRIERQMTQNNHNKAVKLGLLFSNSNAVIESAWIRHIDQWRTWNSGDSLPYLGLCQFNPANITIQFNVVLQTLS